jgi:HK97 family phage portal protein
VGIFKDFGRDLWATVRGKPVDTRSVDTLPWVSGGPSGRMVDTSNALALIPYFASVRILAEQISALPLQTFRDDGEISKRITDGSLIKNPAVNVDKITWTRQMVISLAMRGNAYGLITGFDGLGFATGIEWIHPDEIYVDETSPVLPRYWWASTVGGYGEIPRERMVHIAWFVPPGKRVGLSPVKAFARSIGVGLSAQEYGASWFTNGGAPPATFKNIAKTVTDEQAEEVGARLLRALRSGKPLVHGNDWEFNSIQISPEESQFIETMKMNATQIAAIFGIPPEWVGGETGGSLTYNSPEQNGLHVYKTVLLPWVTLIETNLSNLLPERQHVKFNPDGILRGDLKARYEAHQVAITAGFLTVDEVRKLENLPPLPKPKQPTPIQVPADQGTNDPGNPDPNNPDPNPAPKVNGNGANGRHLPVISGRLN